MDYGLFCLNNRVPADGMAAPEEGFMKKIVIAGNSGSTENYAEALTRLGASCTVTTAVSYTHLDVYKRQGHSPHGQAHAFTQKTVDS